MPDNVINGLRSDPFRKFNFKVELIGRGAFVPWESSQVLGFSEVSGLSSSTEVDTYKEGDRTFDRKLMGKTTFDDVVMSRGMDNNRVLEQWRERIQENGPGLNGELLRAYLRVSLLDRSSRITVFRYWDLFEAWPTSLETEGLSNDSGTLIQRVTFAVEKVTIGP